MTEEEVEVVAGELARLGGMPWSPGSSQDPVLRIVTDRYRDRARMAIAALERFRASKGSVCLQDNVKDPPPGQDLPHEIRRGSEPRPGRHVYPGVTVIYRPPGDRRAYSCRVIKIEGSRAYLEPILRACTGWISIEQLMPHEAGIVPVGER